MYRILVGTLHTIENEFEKCCESIRRQDGVYVEHFVVHNLPNKEAHDTLYRKFMERAQDFDFFVKVDADMVIENHLLLYGIAEKFASMPTVFDLQILVHDFFTDQLIGGMHAYRNTVKWERNTENIFVDIFPVPRGQRYTDETDLAPAALHCPAPSPFQAFHYGVHKAIKCLQLTRTELIKRWSLNHWNNIQKINRNLVRKRDIRIGFAWLGAQMGLTGNIAPNHLDYANPYLHSLFVRYQYCSLNRLAKHARRFSMRNFGFLPANLQYWLLLRWRRYVQRPRQ